MSKNQDQNRNKKAQLDNLNPREGYKLSLKRFLQIYDYNIEFVHILLFKLVQLLNTLHTMGLRLLNLDLEIVYIMISEQVSNKFDVGIDGIMEALMIGDDVEDLCFRNDLYFRAPEVDRDWHKKGIKISKPKSGDALAKVDVYALGQILKLFVEHLSEKDPTFLAQYRKVYRQMTTRKVQKRRSLKIIMKQNFFRPTSDWKFWLNLSVHYDLKVSSI